MSQLPRVSAKQMVSVLPKLGFTLSRQSGSHMIYKNSSGRRATVLFHGNKILHPKILKSIMRDADISLDELHKLL